MNELIKKLRAFVEERNWAQFHSPKNLAMALSVEVSEIVEHFQWLNQEQSRKLDGNALEKVREEIGDVLIYLTMLSDKLGIDPVQAAFDKIEKNRVAYPVDIAKGKADKHRKD